MLLSLNSFPASQSLFLSSFGVQINCGIDGSGQVVKIIESTLTECLEIKAVSLPCDSSDVTKLET
jgi:hypothetical protein